MRQSFVTLLLLITGVAGCGTLPADGALAPQAVETAVNGADTPDVVELGYTLCDHVAEMPVHIGVDWVGYSWQGTNCALAPRFGWEVTPQVSLWGVGNVPLLPAEPAARSVAVGIACQY